jgi:hypothetical protein
MEFIFKHPKTGETLKAEISDEKIREFFEDDAREQIGCNCQPIGETNVVECNCSDFFDEFELLPNA